MGRGLLSQIRDLKGMDIIALADKDIKNTLSTFDHLGISPGDYCFIDSSKFSRIKEKNIEGIGLMVDYL